MRPDDGSLPFPKSSQFTRISLVVVLSSSNGGHFFPVKKRPYTLKNDKHHFNIRPDLIITVRPPHVLLCTEPSSLPRTQPPSKKKTESTTALPGPVSLPGFAPGSRPRPQPSPPHQAPSRCASSKQKRPPPAGPSASSGLAPGVGSPGAVGASESVRRRFNKAPSRVVQSTPRHRGIRQWFELEKYQDSIDCIVNISKMDPEIHFSFQVLCMVYYYSR